MRFISEDSYRGDIKKPESLNLYGYCEGDPIQYVDITGNNRTAANTDDGGGKVGPGASGLKPSDISFKNYFSKGLKLPKISIPKFRNIFSGNLGKAVGKLGLTDLIKSGKTPVIGKMKDLNIVGKIMERNLLQSHNWTYNNGFWYPPN